MFGSKRSQKQPATAAAAAAAATSSSSPSPTPGSDGFGNTTTIIGGGGGSGGGGGGFSFSSSKRLLSNALAASPSVIPARTSSAGGAGLQSAALGYSPSKSQLLLRSSPTTAAAVAGPSNSPRSGGTGAVVHEADWLAGGAGGSGGGGGSNSARTGLYSSGSGTAGPSSSGSAGPSGSAGQYVHHQRTRSSRKPSVGSTSLMSSTTTGTTALAAAPQPTTGIALGGIGGIGLANYNNNNNNTMDGAAPTCPPPPPDPGRYATEDLNFHSKKTWTAEREKVVTGPFEYLFATPGKDFRSQLIASFNSWLEVPAESLEIITRVVGMLHTASLLIDDVEDSSLLRRGLPVAHSIFGTAQTINSANYVYFLALQELQRLRNPKAVSVYAEELVNLHRGQGMDLFLRDTLTCPTEDDYLEMVGNKTGGLFRLAIKLMQAESRSLVDCVPLVNLVGLIFQIRDDYMNLSSPEYSNNKGLCEDLTEGKFSFPIIHAIRADPSNLQLLNILRQKSQDEDVKRYAVSYMEGMGSFEYTRKVLVVLLERARKMIDDIDDGKGRSKGIHKILDKMVI